MYKKLFLSFLSYHFFALSLFSQEIKKGEAYSYARKIVDTLASEGMHGRGYVNGGDSIAAHYLKNEFQKFGLKPFLGDYYQKMSFAVSTFPGKMKVKVGRQELIPGKDYIVRYSFQEHLKIKTKIHYRNKTKHDLAMEPDDFYIVDTLGDDQMKYPISSYDDFPIYSAGITDKLTWSFHGTESTDYNQQVFWNRGGIALSIKRNAIHGFPKKIKIDIESKFLPAHASQNVIGYIPGSEYPDSFIVYSAHYDHLGQMGKDTYFPGANDNASGCAMLLNLAKYYSMPEHKPKCSIAFMAFCGEEIGLLGSKYYTEHPLFPLKNIKFLLNMDIMGTGEDGITVVNGSVFKKEFDMLKAINKENDFIKDVKIRGKAANSDHYFFSEKGVRACFVYTMGGISAYHDIYDRAETLPLNEFEDLFKLITKFGDYLQN